jgi:probable FeS assembly SUF system protein SufT
MEYIMWWKKNKTNKENTPKYQNKLEQNKLDILLEHKIWEQLKTCYDPEIPVNIVELGLIYNCDISPLPSGKNKVSVKMTLTAPGCGMATILQNDVQAKIRALPEVESVDIELVFDPPWDPSRMSEAARLELNLF